MRTGALVLALAGIAALDWAALHDVFEAREPDLLLEVLVVAASLPTLLLVARAMLRPGTRRPVAAAMHAEEGPVVTGGQR